MARIYFVVGVNGVGKSTIIPLLQDRLSPAAFAVHDFDERGVPDDADGAWRASETMHWASVGRDNLGRGISTVVCGFVKAKEIDQAVRALGITPSVCLLDADGPTIQTRIASRYTTPSRLEELQRTTGKTLDKFVQDNVWVSDKFREEATTNGYYILDTSGLGPEQVADKLVAWLK